VLLFPGRDLLGIPVPHVRAISAWGACLRGPKLEQGLWRAPAIRGPREPYQGAFRRSTRDRTSARAPRGLVHRPTKLEPHCPAVLVAPLAPERQLGPRCPDPDRLGECVECPGGQCLRRPLVAHGHAHPRLATMNYGPRTHRSSLSYTGAFSAHSPRLLVETAVVADCAWGQLGACPWRARLEAIKVRGGAGPLGPRDQAFHFARQGAGS
jgi:hypothetical protein